MFCQTRFLAGLSPPTRGSHVGCQGFHPFCGSIPAHAGEPSAPRPARPPMSVYPRPRGGAGAGTFAHSHDWGLSPPTRGSPRRSRTGRRRKRSIPAHAGEPPFDSDDLADLKGLSPPTRGSRDLAEVPHRLRGSIPAHAGEPRTSTSSTPISEVYPRPRGGARAHRVHATARDGLSPPTRGSRPPRCRYSKP